MSIYRSIRGWKNGAAMLTPTTNIGRIEWKSLKITNRKSRRSHITCDTSDLCLASQRKGRLLAKSIDSLGSTPSPWLQASRKCLRNWKKNQALKKRKLRGSKRLQLVKRGWRNLNCRTNPSRKESTTILWTCRLNLRKGLSKVISTNLLEPKEVVVMALPILRLGSSSQLIQVENRTLKGAKPNWRNTRNIFGPRLRI